jgi:hypothetical protein
MGVYMHPVGCVMCVFLSMALCVARPHMCAYVRVCMCTPMGTGTCTHVPECMYVARSGSIFPDDLVQDLGCNHSLLAPTSCRSSPSSSGLSLCCSHQMAAQRGNDRTECSEAPTLLEGLWAAFVWTGLFPATFSLTTTTHPQDFLRAVMLEENQNLLTLRW